MAVTTMAKTNSLVAKLQADFPGVNFASGDDFYWSPRTKTVYYAEKSGDDSQITLLHELSHALLDHRQFERDIDLLKIEREAWDYARDVLAPRYNFAISEDVIERMIDTYRDWLHARSTCPSCSMTGVQTAEATYHCLGCSRDWKVNDARRCGLKRYSVKI